jgi:hypothetical protein
MGMGIRTEDEEENRMTKKEMMLAMMAGKVLEYPGGSGEAWYDKSKPTRYRFRFCSDEVEEEALTAGWEWPDWQVREEGTG